MSSLSLPRESYYHQLPQGMREAAQGSFLISGAITLIFTLDPVCAVLTGTLAATASTIDSLAKPIFKKVFGKSQLTQLEAFGHDLLKYSVVVLTVNALGASIPLIFILQYALVQRILFGGANLDVARPVIFF